MKNAIPVSFLVIGVSIITVYPITAGATQFVLQALGVLYMVSFSALMIGGLIGFLFGIPRAQGSSPDAVATPFVVNTNLEQVSDWLTKVILGVGLTQVNEIYQSIYSFSALIGKQLTMMGGDDLKTVYVLLSIMYFLSLGFILGYLYTRTVILKMFEQTTRLIPSSNI